MLQPSATSGPRVWISEPWGHPKGRTMLVIQQLLLLPTVNKELRTWKIKNWMPTSDSRDTREEWFQWAQPLSSPSYTEKCQISWDTWFSLINNNPLIFRLPVPRCRLLYNLTPTLSPTSSEHLCQGYSESVSQAWRPKNSHQIERNSQVLGCDYFWSLTLSVREGKWKVLQWWALFSE